MNAENEIEWQEDYSKLHTHPQAKDLLNRAYAWVAVTLLITAGVAIYFTSSITNIKWACDNMIWIAIAELVVILAMCFGAKRFTAPALGFLLMVFSALEGVLFGPILSFYTTASLGLTFACTAGTFGVMSLYGVFTKKNLSSWGRGLYMVLIGLIIALVANYFFGNNTLDLILSAVGVVLFSLFTAYDTKNILMAGLSLEGEARAKGAIMGALELYLDIINLFLFLLRFLGDRD